MADLGSIVQALTLLADPTRLRLLALLDGEELSVAELTQILEVAQSRVSTHLGKLRAAGLVLNRRVGTSTRVARVAGEGLAEPYARLLPELIGRLDDHVLAGDLERRRAVLEARAAQAGWPDIVAGQMERHYSPGRTWEANARGLVGLLRLGDVLDIGSGDGTMAYLLAHRARTYTCLDSSPRVIDAARVRLSHLSNVKVAHGDMHSLPFDAGRFDQVLHFHVLTYATDPAAALAEAHRVLRPGGDLALVTLHAHGHAELAASYNQCNTGFRTEELAGLASAAGFEVSLCEVTVRERQMPHFEVVTMFARRPLAEGQRDVA